MAGGEVAQRDADHDREQQRGEPELERGGEPLEEALEHRLAGLDGGAEVALQQRLHVGEVLLQRAARRSRTPR